MSKAVPKPRISWHEGQAAWLKLQPIITPLCHRIMIAGTLRRHSQSVADVDIVLEPRVLVAYKGGELVGDEAPQKEPYVPLWAWIRENADPDEQKPVWAISKGGERQYWPHPHQPTYNRVIFFLEGIQIDLFVVWNPKGWWPEVVCRTGNVDQNIALCGRARKHGGSISWGPNGINGIPGANDSEESFFAALGLPWCPPEFRHEQRWIDYIRRASDVPKDQVSIFTAAGLRIYDKYEQPIAKSHITL